MLGDRAQQRSAHRLSLSVRRGRVAMAAEQLDLDRVHRIDVRVADRIERCSTGWRSSSALTSTIAVTASSVRACSAMITAEAAVMLANWPAAGAARCDLGQVRELDSKGRTAQHLGQTLDPAALAPRARRGAARPGRPLPVPSGTGRESALVGEQALALLLHEHAAEDLTEQPDVPAERCLGILAGQGRVTAPSLADETSAAYFASTPLS